MLMNWVAIPYAMPAMKEAARNAAIAKAEMFADNLRGTSANPEDPAALPPKVSIEQLLRYEQ